MGTSNSKPEKDEALNLCKKRMGFVKKVVDSRYKLSAAHLAYVQSLRNVGINLRRFTESVLCNEPSMCTSEPEKSPSHSSYASPSPSHIVENLGSPMRNSSPMSPRLSNISYTRVEASTAVTVKMDSSLSHFVDDDSLTFPLPPPPPPHLDVGSTWDFFDTSNYKANADGVSRQHSYDPIFINFGDPSRSREDDVAHHEEADAKQANVCPFESNSKFSVSDIGDKASAGSVKNDALSSDDIGLDTVNISKPLIPLRDEGKLALISQPRNATGSGSLVNFGSSLQCSSERGKIEPAKVSAEREDPSEFITHRAKDFLSSVKDIEHRFFRASESGNELLRMLEANKIRLSSCLEKIGRSPPIYLAAIQPPCCLRSSVLDHDPTHNVAKVITWNRSVSSMSSSSRNPLTSAIKDDCDSGSDFIEEYCMISGSHSSTLDRLYAWERKLYDELKASEAIRKEYDRKCFQLRHQFARDMNAQVIDKTRAIVKDLHSQVQVAILAVDSISRRIEKLRDEELLPQILELIQGLIRMWKSMIACHHAQYITISLAYQVRSTNAISKDESYRQVLIHLQNEVGCFASSLAMWIEAHDAYVEALNSWLHTCILLPQERSKRKVTFCPRKAIAPPIFILCQDWSSKIESLPSQELSDAIKAVLSELQNSFTSTDIGKLEPLSEEPANGGPVESKQEGKNETVSGFVALQAALTKMFDRLTKFAEASLKMYEEIKKSSEAAHDAYVNGRVRFIT